MVNCSGGHGQKLLLKAVCQSPDSNKEQVVPLVCEEIWTAVVHKYPFSYLKILIDQQQSLVITHNRSCRECKFHVCAHLYMESIINIQCSYTLS